MEKLKPKVGLLTLMFKLYDAIPTLEPQMMSFANELVDVIGDFAKVKWSGIRKTNEQVDEAIKQFENENLDLIILVLLTYTPSHVALQALKTTRLPILIFNTQRLYKVTKDMDPSALIRNHGMHGVQDVTNVLLRAGRSFQITTGHYKDKKTLTEIKEHCQAASVMNFLKKCRVGIIGYPLEGMGDFALDETSLLNSLGVKVHHISQRDLAFIAKDAPEEAIKAQMEQDRVIFSMADDITKKEHEESSRLEWAVREKLRREGLDAFTANFMAISEEGWLQTLPFLASSKMLSEGFGYAGEGDILTSVVVAMMQRLAGSANFTEMFTMDFEGNAILMSHMGEGNHALAREDRRVEMVGSTLGLMELHVRPLLLRFALKHGPVTLVNLTATSGGRLKIIVTEGKVLDFPPIKGIVPPHFKFQPEKPLNEFLTELSKEGSSHHFALAYGRLSSVIEKIANLACVESAKI
jgi:L-arabinose isomerase